MLDQQARDREYLMKVIDNLQITTSNSLKLQSTTLVQLTSATNELTRQALVRFSYFLFLLFEDRSSRQDFGIKTMFETEQSIKKNVQKNSI